MSVSQQSLVPSSGKRDSSSPNSAEVSSGAAASNNSNNNNNNNNNKPPLQISDGNIFYTSHRKPFTLFFSDNYELCEAPPPITQALAKRKQGLEEAFNEDKQDEPPKNRVLDPLQEALAKRDQLSATARACVALFFYFQHPTDKAKPILCTQASGFFVSPSRIITAYHHLSRRPEGYDLVECVAVQAPNANILTLRESSKFSVKVEDVKRGVDIKAPGPDEDPLVFQNWVPKNDLLVLSVEDEARFSDNFLLPIGCDVGVVSSNRHICHLGFPIFILHDKDILDSFPDTIISEIEEELHPSSKPASNSSSSSNQNGFQYSSFAHPKVPPPPYPPPAALLAQGPQPPPSATPNTISSSSFSSSSIPSSPSTPVVDRSESLASLQAGDFVSGTLTVLVHEAKNLWNAQMFGKQDPYCIITMSKHKKVEYRTKVAKNAGRNAIFELEHFPFSIKERGLKLRVEVYNSNLVADDFIGRTYLNVDDVLAKPQLDWYPIGRDANELTGAGELAMSFLFTPVDSNMNQRSLQEMYRLQMLPPSALTRLAMFNAQLQMVPAPADPKAPVYYHVPDKPAKKKKGKEEEKQVLSWQEQKIKEEADAKQRALVLARAQDDEPFAEGTFTVVVTAAQNLWDSNFLFGKQDPYCKITMSKHKGLVYTTKACKKGGRSAEFVQEHFPFSIKEPGLKLRVEVFSKSLVGPDTFIGRCHLLVDELIKNPQLTWYRVGRNANEKTDAGEVSLAVLFMPVDPEELPELPDIDWPMLELWAVHFLGDAEASKLKGQPPDQVIKAINEKRKKDGNKNPLQMPYTAPRPKYQTTHPVEPERHPVVSPSPSQQLKEETKLPSNESTAVRSVLRNLHRQFFFGYDRLICSPGKLRWGPENDVQPLQHITSTLGKGMAGGPVVVSNSSKLFLGLAIGGYARSKMNVMLSVFHPGFIALYKRFVYTSFTQFLPAEVKQYLAYCAQLGCIDPIVFDPSKPEAPPPKTKAQTSAARVPLNRSSTVASPSSSTASNPIRPNPSQSAFKQLGDAKTAFSSQSPAASGKQVTVTAASAATAAAAAAAAALSAKRSPPPKKDDDEEEDEEEEEEEEEESNAKKQPIAAQSALVQQQQKQQQQAQQQPKQLQPSKVGVPSSSSSAGVSQQRGGKPQSPPPSSDQEEDQDSSEDEDQQTSSQKQQQRSQSGTQNRPTTPSRAPSQATVAAAASTVAVRKPAANLSVFDDGDSTHEEEEEDDESQGVKLPTLLVTSPDGKQGSSTVAVAARSGSASNVSRGSSSTKPTPSPTSTSSGSPSVVAQLGTAKSPAAKTTTTQVDTSKSVTTIPAADKGKVAVAQGKSATQDKPSAAAAPATTTPAVATAAKNKTPAPVQTKSDPKDSKAKPKGPPPKSQAESFSFDAASDEDDDTSPQTPPQKPTQAPASTSATPQRSTGSNPSVNKPPSAVPVPIPPVTVTRNTSAAPAASSVRTNANAQPAATSPAAPVVVVAAAAATTSSSFASTSQHSSADDSQDETVEASHHDAEAHDSSDDQDETDANSSSSVPASNGAGNASASVLSTDLPDLLDFAVSSDSQTGGAAQTTSSKEMIDLL